MLYCEFIYTCVYIVLIKVEEIFSMYVEVTRTDAGCTEIDFSSLSLSFSVYVNARVAVEGNVSGFRCLLLFL